MTSTTRLVPEQVLLLDNAALRAPLDSLKRIHKTTLKTYDYNLQSTSTFQTDLDKLLAKTAASPSPLDEPLDDASRADTLKTIDAMLTRMKGLKRKLADLHAQSDRSLGVVRARLDHLAAVPPSVEDAAYPAWARKRLSHQLVDYMLRANPPLKDSARQLAKEEGVEDLVDADLWDEMAKVEKGLEAGKLDEVLAWVGENRTALKKLKSPLEFTLHLQAYIELCRSRNLLGAMQYARKHLSPAAVAEMNGAGEDGAAPTDSKDGAGEGEGSSHMAELSRAMALLAYPPETTCMVYQDLYSPARWSTLRTLFRSTFLSLHALPSIPLLHMSLQAGLASLKTPICCPVPSGAPTAPASAYPLGGPALRTTITPEGEIVLSSPAASSPLPTPTPTPAPGSASTPAHALTGAQPPIHALEGRPSPSCPLCSSPLGALGPEVPYSHHVNSTIVCGITGRVVEGDGGEGGQLVALVSRASGEGRVYSKEGLVMRASQHEEGKLVDPVTGEVFEWDELKKLTAIAQAPPSHPSPSTTHAASPASPTHPNPSPSSTAASASPSFDAPLGYPSLLSPTSASLDAAPLSSPPVDASASLSYQPASLPPNPFFACAAGAVPPTSAAAAGVNPHAYAAAMLNPSAAAALLHGHGLKVAQAVHIAGLLAPSASQGPYAAAAATHFDPQLFFAREM
ncbi:hypothetical protein JCM10207_001390 [Rhodosporidiobolus poonsookiae]